MQCIGVHQEVTVVEGKGGGEEVEEEEGGGREHHGGVSLANPLSPQLPPILLCGNTRIQLWQGQPNNK